MENGAEVSFCVLMISAVLLPSGHTFTEILTFKPVVPDSKETAL